MAGSDSGQHNNTPSGWAKVSTTASNDPKWQDVVDYLGATSAFIVPVLGHRAETGQALYPTIMNSTGVWPRPNLRYFNNLLSHYWRILTLFLALCGVV